ncbi:MAG: response regulator [Candidatus Brocadiaceae bacterium]|nr:response regulator [Candidatus Brocadiaceae bacterium]
MGESGKVIKANILLIDYEETHRSIYTSFLRYAGYAVTAAPDGIEGLSLFKQGSYDLVLCALEMPYLSGVEVARAIKTFCIGKGRKVPFIMVASRTHEVTQEEMRKTGIDTVFFKPLRLDHLSESIKGLISARR